MMVATAIVQNGGIFIPDIGKFLGVNHGQLTVNITIINTRSDDDPFDKAAGIRISRAGRRTVKVAISSRSILI